MGRRCGQFTIGNLMLTVAVAAGLLSLHPMPRGIAIVLAVPWLATITARWLISRRHRRLAAWGFWAVATWTNLAVAALCIAPDVNSKAFWLMQPILWLDLLPTTIALGVAWAFLLSRVADAPRRSAGRSVLLDPSHGRAAGRDALDPLAAPHGVPRRPSGTGSPGRSGRRRQARRLSAAAVGPVPDRGPGHRAGVRRRRPEGRSRGTDTGFVRIHAGTTPTTHGPFVGVNFDIYLGGGWWYRG